MVYRRRNKSRDPNAPAGQEGPAGQTPPEQAGAQNPEGKPRQGYRRGRRPYRGGGRDQSGSPSQADRPANGGRPEDGERQNSPRPQGENRPPNPEPRADNSPSGSANRQDAPREGQGQNRRFRRRGRSGNRGRDPRANGENRGQNDPRPQPPIEKIPGGPDLPETNLMPYDGVRVGGPGEAGEANRRPGRQDKNQRGRQGQQNQNRGSQPGGRGGRNRPGENRPGDPRSGDTRRSDQRRDQNRPAQEGPKRATVEIEPGVPKAGKEHIRGPRVNRGNRGPRQDQRSGSKQRPSGGTYSPIDYRERGDRRSFYDFSRPEPTVPIRTDAGIKARSQRGTFSQNWWARRWIEAMEQLVDPGRLQRGRHYARTGQVLSLTEARHGITAQVQGSRPTPYDVSIQVTPLTDDQWDAVIDALSEQALFTAQLLAGEMPGSIEEAFHSAGVSLFPSHAGDLYSNCSCPDWANPCKHVAATHYILGDRFDDDPFLLFRMRGRSQEQILQALRARRAGLPDLIDADIESQAAEDQGQPLEDLIGRFWDPVEDLDSFPLTIRPPTVDMPLLQRLGEPAFLGGESLSSLLKPVYDIFTRSALRAAYSEEEPEESSVTPPPEET